MTQLLQEFVDSRGVTLKVDQQAGILRGVKLIGLQSQNGRRYLESALEAAASMYEDAKVNVNHPKEGPATPRDYQDRLGVIRGVNLRSGEGLFADFHFNPKHALAEQLLWDAEHNPRNVGFSHNVLARLSREGEVAVVEEITKVQSVDLVADPATTQGLFEHASKQTANSNQPDKSWDALTMEVLQLHRPDLIVEIESLKAQKLQQQLAEAEVVAGRLKRKQRIYELLCEHQLVVSEETTESHDLPRRVSSCFVDLLMDAADESVVESLVFERARLAQAAMSNRQNAAGLTVPFSREQTQLLGHQPIALQSAEKFAATLKSSLN